MGNLDRIVEYRRDYAHIDGREVWCDSLKWESLLSLLESSKGKMDTLVIEAPEVLGDTYREFVVNLSAIAEAGLKVMILPGSRRIVGLTSVGFKDANGQRVERGMAELSESTVDDEKIPGMARAKGDAILRMGRQPPVIIVSIAPDELYAKAELLLMLEKEIHTPSNEGREIVGCYEANAGTLDVFFEQYVNKPDDLRMLEKKRLEIIEKGWDRFIMKPEALPKGGPGPRGGMRHRILSKDASIEGEEQALVGVIQDMKKKMSDEGVFTCLICMEKRKNAHCDTIGLVGHDDFVDRPIGKLKEFPYWICTTCAPLPREKIFSKVDENIYSYRNVLMKDWQEMDSAKKYLDKTVSNLEALMEGGPALIIEDDLPSMVLNEIANKVALLSKQIKTAGHFTCVCCLEKKGERLLGSIGSFIPGDKTKEEAGIKASIAYPVCTKCAKMSDGEMTQLAEKNLKQSMKSLKVKISGTKG